MTDADKPSLVGEDHRLDPVAQAELGQYPADVRLDRALDEVQARRDLRIGQPARDQREYFALASGQHVEHIKSGLVLRRPLPDEPLDEPAGYCRRDDRLTRGDSADRGHQFRREGVFEDEAACPWAEPSEDILI